VLWIVVAAVVVLVLVVLGVVAYVVLGAFGRLGREADALDREVRPLVEQAQAAAARADERAANRG
jgi:hypothetical protein